MDNTAFRIPRDRRRQGAERGFTLIEALVTIAILAVLAAVAAPSYNNAIMSNKLTSYANSFVSSALLARSEAIKRNTVVRVCRSADGVSCATSGTWQQGWIVFNDINNDGAVDTNETVILTQQAIGTDYHFTETSGTPIYSVAFQPTGVGTTAASLLLCRATPSPGNQERTISVGATGRTTVATTRTGTCS